MCAHYARALAPAGERFLISHETSTAFTDPSLGPEDTPFWLVVRLLDRETADVYPHDVRERLAECAIRHAGLANTDHRTFKRAVKWLRDNGHL